CGVLLTFLGCFFSGWAATSVYTLSLHDALPILAQGALGVWTALEYAPASYSKTDELIALSQAASRHGGIYASHMRDEGQHIDEALNEVFRIAREAHLPAEVSHLKLSGRRSWGQMPRILAKIDSARAAGLDVTADQYPYIRAA